MVQSKKARERGGRKDGRHGEKENDFANISKKRKAAQAAMAPKSPESRHSKFKASLKTLFGISL